MICLYSFLNIRNLLFWLIASTNLVEATEESTEDFAVGFIVSNISKESEKSLVEQLNIAGALNEIRSTESGKELLNELGKQFKNPRLSFTIIIKQNLLNEALSRGDNEHIQLHLGNVPLTASIGEVLYKTNDGTALRLIEKIQTPFDVLLFHELVHVYHILKNFGEYLDCQGLSWGCQITKAKKLGLLPEGLFPELVDRQGSLWENLEERRTVYGAWCTYDEFTPKHERIFENRYRLERGYPMRYIQQGNEHPFFEVDSIIGAVHQQSGLEGEQLVCSHGVAVKGQEYDGCYTPDGIAKKIYYKSLNYLRKGTLNPDPEQ